MPKTVNLNHSLILFHPYIGPLLGTTTPGQSAPGSNDNERVLCIPQSSSITGVSSSDCLVSYSGHSYGGVLPLYREAVGVYSTAPVDRARNLLGWTN